MPMYETIFIAQPDLPEADADALSETFQQVVRDSEGNLVKSDRWGKRKLAYPLSKHQEGYFFHLQFEADPAVLTEVERRLRNSEQILKFLSVRLDRRAIAALAAAEKKAAEKAAARAVREAERAARQQQEEAAAPPKPAATEAPAPAAAPPKEAGTAVPPVEATPDGPAAEEARRPESEAAAAESSPNPEPETGRGDAGGE